MLNQIISLGACILSVLLVITVLKCNSYKDEINDLQRKLNNAQIKQFNISSELANERSKSYELKKQSENQSYEKIANKSVNNYPCIDSDSLQELNNYISSTSASKP